MSLKTWIINGDNIPDPVRIVVLVEPVEISGTVTRNRNNGSFGYKSSGDNRGSISCDGEVVRLSVESIEVDGGYDIQFDGFTGVSFRSYGVNDRHEIDGVLGDANSTNDAVEFEELKQQVDVGYAENLDPGNPGSDLNSGFRLDSYGFLLSSNADVVAIPEPRLSLLLLSTLALMAGRQVRLA